MFIIMETISTLVASQARVLVQYPISLNLRLLTSLTDNPIELDMASNRHSSCDISGVYTRQQGSTYGRL